MACDDPPMALHGILLSPTTYLPAFYQVRPILEIGYESVILLRLLVEGHSVLDILQFFRERRDLILVEWGVTKDFLIHVFGEVRDRWIQENEMDWLESHDFYPGVISSLKLLGSHSFDNVFIITTKQQRFVEKLLQTKQVDFPSDHIFGLGSPKIKVLQQILDGHSTKGPVKKIYFVEDRLDTIESVQKTTGLEGVGLYFATWGYSTSLDKENASKNGNLTCLSLTQFCDWLVKISIKGKL